MQELIKFDRFLARRDLASEICLLFQVGLPYILTDGSVYLELEVTADQAPVGLSERNRFRTTGPRSSEKHEFHGLTPGRCLWVFLLWGGAFHWMGCDHADAMAI